LAPLEGFERGGRSVFLLATIADAEHAREPRARFPELPRATRHRARVVAQPFDEGAVGLHERPGLVERGLLRGRKLGAGVARSLVLDREEEGEGQRELSAREHRRAPDTGAAA